MRARVQEYPAERLGGLLGQSLCVFLFEGPAVFLQALRNKYGASSLGNRLAERFVRTILIYPFGSIMLRVSLLDTEDAIDRVRTRLRGIV